jgi:predicted DCC family thiol-disulfide oxidoreductase YuxK
MCVHAYSYRSDAQVPPFDDTQPLLIFDGHCVLCSDGVRRMLTRDPHGTTRFAAIQTPIPRALYRHYNLDADRFDTFMVLADGTPYALGRHARCRAHHAGALVLARHSRAHVPDVIGDHLYDWVQRNRFRWFGARDVCFQPDATQSHRFL